MAEQVAAEQAEREPRLSRGQVALLLAALLCAAAMWGYVAWVLIPYQVGEAAEVGRPRGNLSDLYPRWLGSREMLLHGADPYSREVTLEIQRGYYGMALDPNNPAHPKDQQGFAYPVYVAFLLAPLIGLPFDAVQEGFGWLLIAVAALSVPLWQAALRIRFSPAVTVAVMLLTVGSFPVVQGYALQQLTLLVTFGLAAALALPANGRYAAAGVLLALATIKPQLVALLLPGLGIWSLRRLRVRQDFLWGFAATMLVLLAGSELLLPGWIAKFAAALGEYQRYTGGVSLLNTFFSLLGAEVGSIVGGILTVLLSVICLLFWDAAGREAAPGRAFAEALALTLAVTLAIIPTWAPYNQVLLLPALLLLIHYAGRAWREGGRAARYAYLLTAGVVAWPWAAALLLVVGAGCAALLGGDAMQQVLSLWPLPLATSLFIPIAVLITLIIARPVKPGT